MENRIRDRYTKSILEQALECYQIPSGWVQALDGFESYIFEYDSDQGPGILRISHSFRRNPDLIRGELDWINYLDARGVSVARLIASQSRKLVEVIDDEAGGSFLATAFERVDGEPHRGVDWSPELLDNYGRLVGRLHRFSRTYQPKQASWKRPEWDDPLMLEIDQFLPEEDQLV